MINSRYLATSTLLFANFVTILLFFLNSGSVMQLFWIYWWQSIIIGAINVIRLLISPMRIAKADGSEVGTLLFIFHKAYAAAFFVIHFGFFQWLYYMMLGLFTRFPMLRDPVNNTDIIICCILFAMHHIYTFVIEQIVIWKDRSKKPTIQDVMFRPYFRTIPMHGIFLIAFFGGILLGSEFIAVAFVAIKTVVDIYLDKNGIILPVPQPTKTGTNI